MLTLEYILKIMRKGAPECDERPRLMAPNNESRPKAQKEETDHAGVEEGRDDA